MVEPKFSKNLVKEIPEFLIYEKMDGKAIYYRDYQKVLNGEIDFEGIMGVSSLQAFIIEYVVGELLTKLDRKQYRVFFNEIGIHLDHRNNISHDIAIFEKSVLPANKISTNYADVPCKLAIEIDIKADLGNEKHFDYIQKKTQKTLDFGTEKVIWIFSNSQQITLAEKDKTWQTLNWNEDIVLIEDIQVNIAQFLKEEGIQLN